MKHTLTLLVFISVHCFGQATDEMHIAVLEKKLAGRFEFNSFWLLGELSLARPYSLMANVSPTIDQCKRDLQIVFSKDHTGTYYTGQHGKGCKKQAERFTWKIERVITGDQKKDFLTITIDAFDNNKYELKELTEEKLQLIGDFSLGGDTTSEGVMEMRKKRR